MTGRDERPGADVLTFPRVGLPAFLRTDPAPADGDGDAPVPPAPRVPDAREMAPPLHLTMPAISLPGDGDVEDDEGEFIPPDYDPDHPTAQDAVAVGLAMMTALGIAGARGMWQAGASWRARAAHQRALAEKAQAEADKARAAAKGAPTATATRSSGTAAKGTSGGSKGGGGSRSVLGSPAATKRTSGSDGRTGSVSHPKTGRKGRADASSTGSPSGKQTSKRRFWKKDQDPQDGGSRKQKKTADGKTPGKKTGSAKATDAKTDGAKTGGKKAADTKTDSKKDDGAKASDAKTGSKKTDGTKTADAKTGGAKTDGAKADSKKTDSAKADGAKAADAKADGRKTADAKTGGETPRTRADGVKAEQEKPQERGERQTPSVPGLPTWQDMRPPQRADTTVQTTVERLDQDQPQRLDAAGDVPSASASAGPSEGETVTVMPMGRPNTQYTDAELTIYDVIEADADMAGEITDGVTEATRSAEACDRLFSKLEVLHAEIVDLKVPGVLEGMVLALMDKVVTVKARAQAIAEKLPAAAESISTAGSNAAARHQGLADAVRDAGHARPAERDYHNE